MSILQHSNSFRTISDVTIKNMAGHSHWAQIKRQKGVNDAKKAKVFTKLGKTITHAAREGGGDPQFNIALANAITQARAVNMPKDNIEKAIKKGTGELEGVHLEERTYEGYGPMGEAYLIEVLTDNINRTVAEIRHTFTHYQGSLGTTGSAAYIFAQDKENPSFYISIENLPDAQKVLELAEALDEHDDVTAVYTNFDIPDELTNKEANP